MNIHPSHTTIWSVERVTKIFWGFKSRCNTLAEWIYFRALRICKVNIIIVFIGIFFVWFKWCKSQSIRGKTKYLKKISLDMKGLIIRWNICFHRNLKRINDKSQPKKKSKEKFDEVDFSCIFTYTESKLASVAPGSKKTSERVIIFSWRRWRSKSIS